MRRVAREIGISPLWFSPLIVWAIVANPSVGTLAVAYAANMLGYWEGRFRPEVRWSRR